METANIAFIVDVHAGKLAKNLRLLGFDTWYRNDYSNQDLLELARTTGRTLLSRNPAFCKKPAIRFFQLLTEDTVFQTQAVIQQFALRARLAPFSRCLVCNGQLKEVLKDKVTAELEENTARWYHEFWQCSSCRRIYWKGPHYNRMQNLLQQLKTLSG